MDEIQLLTDVLSINTISSNLGGLKSFDRWHMTPRPSLPMPAVIFAINIQMYKKILLKQVVLCQALDKNAF